MTYENPPGVHSAADRVRAFESGPLAEWFNYVNVNAHEAWRTLHPVGEPRGLGQ